MKKKLEGLVVVFFEARHEKTMGDLIRVQGGTPLAAPALKEVPLENNPAAFSFAEKLFKNEIDVLILLTGVGTRALVSVLETRYEKEKILDAFRKIKIIPRGPKPIRVLNEFKVPFAVTVPEPNTWKELIASIQDWDLKGKSVAVQEYGVSNPELLEALEKMGAQILRVPVYRWALPDDTTPLKNAIQKIISNHVDVVIFTTAVQVNHLFQVAEQMGVGAQLIVPLRKIAVASVGPDCSQAIREKGVQVDIEPESPKMGPLVVAVAQKAKEILKHK